MGHTADQIEWGIMDAKPKRVLNVILAYGVSNLLLGITSAAEQVLM